MTERTHVPERPCLHGIKTGKFRLPAKFNIPGPPPHRYVAQIWTNARVLAAYKTSEEVVNSYLPSLSISRLSVSQIWGKATLWFHTCHGLLVLYMGRYYCRKRFINEVSGDDDDDDDEIVRCVE